MLVVTRQADYALRACVEVAQIAYGERISTATIAEQGNIPLPFLAKIVAQLVTKGILKTSRGLGGGVSLTRLPGDITMLEIIEAIDGPVLLNTCVFDPGSCERSSRCSICEVFVEAQRNLADELESVTLGKLEARAHQLTAKQATTLNGISTR